MNKWLDDESMEKQNKTNEKKLFSLIFALYTY